MRVAIRPRSQSDYKQPIKKKDIRGHPFASDEDMCKWFGRQPLHRGTVATALPQD